jgi:two-component system sensor histidine kinase KdpD
MEKSTISDNQKKCMGIGLSVCAAIIKAHGGEISADNLKQGGMRFRFSLELEEAIGE